MTAQSPKYCYRLDAADRIVWLDKLWLAFARENGAAHLTESRVLMQPLWGFIAGEYLRELFERIHDRVRSTSNSIVLPFRCDSPNLQRHMRLNIKPEKSGMLLYECVLVRTVQQEQAKLLGSESARCESVLTVCSCCKRALLEPVGWLELEDICARLKLLEMPKVPHLRHSVCSDCAQVMQKVATEGGNA